MAEILGAAAAATNYLLEVNRISIDNGTFKLFYFWTPAILFTSAIIIICKQFFGGPINCEVVKSILKIFFTS